MSRPLALLISALLPAGLLAQQSSMPSVALPAGWRLTTMAQAFPVVTIGAPGGVSGDALSHTGWYVTQPAIMTHAASAGQRVAVHTTLNFEGLTQEDGELTFGGWGEGFIDKRHPHTLLHELMVSVNAWDAGGGGLSLSAGKGFAPYGTSDPMARPGLKYPTNHHLSQILERWTVNASLLRGGWSLEAGVFGGLEPEGTYDFGNIKSFGDSWSARIGRRWGLAMPEATQWQTSASFGSLIHVAHGAESRMRLANVALIRIAPIAAGRLYVLTEASRSFSADHDDYFSVLGETRYDDGGRQPYARVEYASRPEYPREGVAGDDDFFRYDDAGHTVGRTRWLIVTAAYAQQVTPNPWSVRPFLEVQYHRVQADQGVGPIQLYGRPSFWALTFGVRLLFGGDPMRMGAYGVVDPVTEMSRTGAAHVH